MFLAIVNTSIHFMSCKWTRYTHGTLKFQTYLPDLSVICLKICQHVHLNQNQMLGHTKDFNIWPLTSGTFTMNPGSIALDDILGNLIYHNLKNVIYKGFILSLDQFSFDPSFFWRTPISPIVPSLCGRNL